MKTCKNNSETCLGPITALNLCRSCYKRQYRAKNRDRLINQERTRWDKNKVKTRISSNAYKTTPRGRYGIAISEAKRRELPFRLTFEEFKHLLLQPCYYCEREGLDTLYGHRLDRIENSEGYCVENVVPCCGKCNRIRGDNLTFIEMIVAMRAVTKFRSSLYD